MKTAVEIMQAMAETFGQDRERWLGFLEAMALIAVANALCELHPWDESAAKQLASAKERAAGFLFNFGETVPAESLER